MSLHSLQSTSVPNEGTLSNHATQKRALLDEPNPVPVCFLQLVGKRYPLKAVRTLGKRKNKGGRGMEEGEAEENYSLQTEPSWEHKAFSGTISILCARCKPILWEAPEKGRDSSKRIEPGKVDFVFDRQPNTFSSGLVHRWLSGHLTGEIFFFYSP